MSAFAMFGLKDPSLLAFDQRRRDPNDNFRTIYGINRVPCDSRCGPFVTLSIRRLANPVPRDLPSPPPRQGYERFNYWTAATCCPRRNKLLFLQQHPFCPCLVKNPRNGNTTYSHQLLGATRSIRPQGSHSAGTEPIIQQDGQTKNDCERNATRRWLKRFRQEHPQLSGSSSKTPSAQRTTSATCVRPGCTT